jgi:aerobic-type carbon monoxide dehydrogenase small subunit (CoxS/CutS family)
VRTTRLTLNGDAAEIAAPDHWTLLEALRYRAGLTGSKQGCDKGDCGACTLHVDGRAVLSCLTLLADVEGRAVTTVEGLVSAAGPDVVQDCFDAAGCLQCGFCQPGMIMAARQLVTENPRASLEEIQDALSSNLCRCTGYTKIFEAVQSACRRELERAARPGGEGASRAAGPVA